MKRITQIGCVIIGLFFIANSPGFAQVADETEQNIDLGIGLAYGTEIESLGITADAYYILNQNMRVGGGLTYFFPEETPSANINWFAIDLNGQYLFYAEENMNVYALAGLNIIIQSINFEDFVGQDDLSETYVGLNLGAGIEYGLNFADLFGELKLAGLGGDADQLVLSAGLRFDI